MIPNIEPQILRESPTSLLIDARGGLGAPVSVDTMTSIIGKAEIAGVAFGCVRNSNHFGIAGRYAMMALSHDMIGMAMTNTAALGVPTFGRQVMFGTNPLASRARWDREELLYSTCRRQLSPGKIEVYDRMGKELPSGWAVDKTGLPARDPRSLLDDMLHRKGGGIVPLGGDSELTGGHKGYGLAVMVDILTGLLAGGGFGLDVMDTNVSSARVSHCFAAMKIDLFQRPDNSRRNGQNALRLASCPYRRRRARVFAGPRNQNSRTRPRRSIRLDENVFRRWGFWARNAGQGASDKIGTLVRKNVQEDLTAIPLFGPARFNKSALGSSCP